MLVLIVGEQFELQVPSKTATLPAPGADPPDQFPAVLQLALPPAPLQI